MQIIILIIIGLLGIFIGKQLAIRRKMKGAGLPAGRQGSLAKVNTEKKIRKESAKKKILELFSQKDKITNNDVEKLLGVSDATATNYLQELENEQKIVQQGIEGRGVFYTQING